MDERTVKVNAWSSGEWTFTLPDDGALGNYAVRAVLAGDRKQPGAKPDRDVSGGEEEELDQVEDDVPWNKTVRGSFLVAAYRKPDFRVDVTLTGTTMLAGRPAPGRGDRPLPVRRADAQAADALDLYANAAPSAPEAILAKYPGDRWTFVGWSDNQRAVCAPTWRRTTGSWRRMDSCRSRWALMPRRAFRTHTRSKGTSRTCRGSTSPTASARSCTRHRGTSASSRFHISISRKTGARTELVAVGLDGAAVAGIPIDVTLTQIQWLSVRHAEGNGFYSWDTQRKEVPSGEWHLTSAADPVALDIPLPSGGFFILEARAQRRPRALHRDPDHRSTRWERATPHGSASITIASISSPSARPTSRGRRRAS